MHDIPGGDNRYYNNIFVSPEGPVPWPDRIPAERDTQHYYGLAIYDPANLPMYMAGNVFLGKAEPSKHELSPLVAPELEPGFKFVEKADGWYLETAFSKTWAEAKRPLVTSRMLGMAQIPDLPFEEPDGKPYRLDKDYFGNKRNSKNPYPGPFTTPKNKTQHIKTWPAR